MKMISTSLTNRYSSILLFANKAKWNLIIAGLTSINAEVNRHNLYKLQISSYSYSGFHFAVGKLAMTK
jgi:hypothetical protein